MYIYTCIYLEYFWKAEKIHKLATMIAFWEGEMVGWTIWGEESLFFLCVFFLSQIPRSVIYIWKNSPFLVYSCLIFLENIYSHVPMTTVKIQNISINLQNSRGLLCNNPSLSIQSLTTTGLFSVPVILPFPAHRINAITRCVTFWGWLLPLSILCLQVTHVEATVHSCCWLIFIVQKHHGGFIHQLNFWVVSCSSDCE